jgi:hypothetical protein
MWAADRRRGNRLGNTLVAGEVLFIAVVIIAIGAYVWQQARIGWLNVWLQVAFVGAFGLAIVFAANYVVSRRW